MEKRLIFVTSPPACGKTRLSKMFASELKHVVYLDKDTLIPLSKQIFAVAGEEYNRSSAFFEKEIRNYEYDVIMDLAFEALKYENLVMVNAPFTREIRDNEYIKALREKLAESGAKLTVVWIVTDPEVCPSRVRRRVRLLRRKAESDGRGGFLVRLEPPDRPGRQGDRILPAPRQARHDDRQRRA